MSFSKDFLWGAASAAFQVEGGYLDDGKGMGIWDALSEGHVKHGDNGNVSCDHYHRYKEDVAIMKEMGLKSYRFSISWPRVMPEPGVINEKGLQFYGDLVTELKAAGIEPLVTLFHWNLPLWLHEMGGWACPKAPEYFEQYTRVVAKALSDRVRYWLTFNEPQCFVGVGYYVGTHAPFEKRPIGEIKEITRIVMLSHGRSVKALRECCILPPKIGFAPTCQCYEPKTESPEGIEEARSLTFLDQEDPFTNVWWADPIVAGQVPGTLQEVLSEEDMKLIHQPLDFYAYNTYYSDNNTDTFGTGLPFEAPKPGMPRSSMEWPVTPGVIYWATRFFYERYGLPIMITENGVALSDWEALDGGVHDPNRADFLVRYLRELKRACEEQIPVLGYHYWSIMDNFEWAEGYTPRFGLVYVDYTTGKRIVKDSAAIYNRIIAENGENL